MDFHNRVVLDAQADGLACVYCGRSCRREGSLAPLRAQARGATRFVGGFTVIGGVFTADRVIRCDPPCREAHRAIFALWPTAVHRGPG